jgi:hypothetical protein
MATTTYEIWRDDLGPSLVRADDGTKFAGMGAAPTLLLAFQARTGEEARVRYHEFLGLEPYVPEGNSAPCPRCGSHYYPNGSAECANCGPVG